jgi:hypothetical protein
MKKEKAARLLKREIRAASSRNKVTMQIQTGASRRRKKQTRRQRKQFPWNIPPYEWRPQGWTTPSTQRESLPIVDTFLPRDFLLSSTLIPPPRPSICLFFSPLLIDRLLVLPRNECIWRVPSRRVFAIPFPSLTFYLDFSLSLWFDSSRTVPQRDFEIFEICFVSRLFFQDENRESNHKCDSTVDYARKIASDGPSTVTSIECMHSKCIGARMYISILFFLAAVVRTRSYKEGQRHAVALGHHWWNKYVYRFSNFNQKQAPESVISFPQRKILR